VLDRSHDKTAELAAIVFELLQTLRQQWLTADYAAKASNPRNRVFELPPRRRNPRPHNEKALRRYRRRASCLVKSGQQDLNRVRIVRFRNHQELVAPPQSRGFLPRVKIPSFPMLSCLFASAPHFSSHSRPRPPSP
jgi:hypothetical protein